MPPAGAVVCIPADTTVVVDGTTSAVPATVLGPAASLEIRAGGLSIFSTTNPSSLRDLTITGGYLGGPGTMSVSGTFRWSGGTMADVGSTVLGAGSVGTIDPSTTVSLTQRTLVNQGVLTWSSGTVRGSHAGVLQNSGSFVANSESTNGFRYDATSWGGGVTITNTSTGTLSKTSGTGTTFIGVPLINQGTVSALSGTMGFSPSGSAAAPQSTGTWNTSSGALITWQGSYALGPGSVLSGAFAVASGLMTITGLQAPNASLTLASAGSVTVNDPLQPSTLRDLTMSGGSLGGTATLNVTGSLTWSAGLMYGTGATVLAPGATSTINATSSVRLDQRTLTNQGSLTWSAGTLQASTGATLQNGGTFIANSEDGSGLQYYTGSGTGGGGRIFNSGTIRKSAGSGVTRVGVGVANTGTIEAQSGTLGALGGGISGTPSTAAWTAAAGAHIQMAGNATLATGTNLSGAIDVIGGVTNVSGLQATSASLSISGIATLNVNDPTSPSNLRDLTITAGSLAGAGTLGVRGSLSWSGGSMTGTGLTVLGASATGTINPATSVSLIQRALVNRGVLTWSSGSLQGLSGATLDNSGMFVANSENSSGMSNSGSPTPLLINSTVVMKTQGTGTTKIFWALGNRGVVAAVSGTLQTLGPIVAVGAPGQTSMGRVTPRRRTPSALARVGRWTAPAATSSRSSPTSPSAARGSAWT